MSGFSSIVRYKMSDIRSKIKYFIPYIPYLVILIFLTSYFLFLPSHTFADEYHYNNILVGDRAAGMGGAYTAISDDSAGLYYNPAGIVFSPGGSLSASANAYHITNTRYKGVIGGNDWERKSSALLPNYFGIIQSLGKGKVGFSYTVTDSILEDQDQVFSNIPGHTSDVINFNKNDNIYNAGLSYALRLSDVPGLKHLRLSEDFSAGITFYGHYRENQWIMNQLYNLTTGEYEWGNAYYQTNEMGIRPVIGLMWIPAEKFSIGLAMSQTTILNSTTRFQQTYKGATYTANKVDRTDFTVNYRRVFPLTAVVGIAYFASDSLLFSGDFSYYAKTSDANFGDREATWNAALGTEYYITEKWGLRAGIFTNRANTSEINTGDVDKFDHVDIYGGSISITHFSRQSSLTFGADYGFGSGKAQVLGGSYIQDVEMQTLTGFVSAAYSY